MAVGTLAPLGRQTFFDGNGDPLSSGTLETYAAGTSTALATYSDVGLITANPTTITLNSAGRPQVSGTEVALYLTPGLAYKFIVKNSAGSTIWTQDNIGAVPASTVDLDVTGTAGETLTAGEVVYLSDGSGALVAGRWYRADADLNYASVLAAVVGMVPVTIASGASGSIRIAGRMTGLSGLTAGVNYYASATAGALTATAPAFARVIGRADGTTTLVLSFGSASASTAGKPYLIFRPQQAEPPTANYATFDYRNVHPVLDFDGTTDEETVFSGVLPPSYSGGGLTVDTWWSLTSATSGSFRVQADLERITLSTLDIDADSFTGTFQSAGGTAPATSGMVVKVSIVFTDGAQMDSLAGGELFRVKIRRDADATSGTDDITTDAELRMVVVRET